MKIIRVHEDDPLVESCKINDLVWVSCEQLPFDNLENYVRDYIWDIPCELALVDELLLTSTGQIWGLGVRSLSRPDLIVGIYIEDVMQNWTEHLKNQREHQAVQQIEEAYHVHYTTRKIAANRIKRAYIRHYWNPQNPLMKARLMAQYFMMGVIG
jgi:hypothetical protein